MTVEAKEHLRRICPIIGSMVYTIDYRLLDKFSEYRPAYPRRIARRRFQSGSSSTCLKPNWEENNGVEGKIVG
jgi:hypothetical protein